ncbi:hypothetical protein BH24ACT3_BH24ACT3_10780 [soil metagenome]
MTGSGADPDRLTEADVARVLRRAAELDAVDDHPDSWGIEVAALEEAAREVGLSHLAVRRAVAELRADLLPVAADGTGRADRPERLGPCTLSAERIVPVEAAVVRQRLQVALRRETFALRRDDGTRTVWQRRDDLLATLRRTLELAGRLKLTDTASLTVVIVAVPEGSGTLIWVDADVRTMRNHILAGAAGTPVAATATGGGLLALLTGDVAVLAGTAPVVAAAGYGGGRLGLAYHRRRAARLADALTRFIDRLARSG